MGTAAHANDTRVMSRPRAAPARGLELVSADEIHESPPSTSVTRGVHRVAQWQGCSNGLSARRLANAAPAKGRLAPSETQSTCQLLVAPPTRVKRHRCSEFSSRA